MEKLLKLNNDLTAVLQEHTETDNKKKMSGDKAFLQEQIEKALTAADDFDSDAGIKALNDLLVYDFGEEINADLEKASMSFKEFNYDGVKETLNKLK